MAQILQVDNFINQTIIESNIEKVKIEPTTQFQFLYYLRIIIYVIIVIKLMEIIFMRRRKLKINQRIQRKFLMAHGAEMLKEFSPEEYQLMNITLQNTLKNAIQHNLTNNKRNSSKIRKSVSFVPQSNTYYDHGEVKSSKLPSRKSNQEQSLKKQQNKFEMKMQQEKSFFLNQDETN